MRWFLLGAVIGLLGTACSRIRPKASERFLNMDSLLSSQVKALTKAGAILEKTVTVDDSTETQSFLDTTIWRREFQMFEGLRDLNKSTYQGEFAVSDTTDTRSNLKVKDISHTSEQQKNTMSSLALQHVRLYYLDDGSLVGIEAHFVQSRPMYRKQEQVELDFSSLAGNRLLKRYVIQGGQRIVMGDTLTYRIEGDISIPNRE